MNVKLFFNFKKNKKHCSCSVFPAASDQQEEGNACLGWKGKPWAGAWVPAWTVFLPGPPQRWWQQPGRTGTGWAASSLSRPRSWALDWEPRALHPEHSVASKHCCPSSSDLGWSFCPRRDLGSGLLETFLQLVGRCLSLACLRCEMDRAVT